jgi:radical SAM superfamily enzyme YgiQ (UPF0313 family)
MFKDKRFRIRELNEVLEDLVSARSRYHSVKKIFLADADALVLKPEHLSQILLKIRLLFPECIAVSSYTTAKDLLRKSLPEIIQLREQGLTMLYLGIESGNDQILKDVNKGVSAAEMVEAGNLVKKAGILLSVTLISGLGGVEHSRVHALDSAKVINSINPDYLGLLTLTIDHGTEMYERVTQRQELTTLTPLEVMKENRCLIEHLEVIHCILRSNHVCNYVPLAGTLNEDKEALLGMLDELIDPML